MEVISELEKITLNAEVTEDLVILVSEHMENLEEIAKYVKNENIQKRAKIQINVLYQIFKNIKDIGEQSENIIQYLYKGAKV